MASVISWKVAPGKYAYITKPNGRYIQGRITDSAQLNDMASTVRGWSESEYTSAFNEMQTEVNNIYGNLEGTAGKYYNLSELNDASIVLLAGDGADAANLGDDGSILLADEDYRKLIEDIERQFLEQSDILINELNRIKDSIEHNAGVDLTDAIRQINEAKERIANTERRLTDIATSAEEALRMLNELGGGELTPEQMEDILSKLSTMKDWLGEMGDKIKAFITEYDAVLGNLGSMGIAYDVSQGLLSIMLSNINTISGTVGTVSQTMNAQRGELSQLTTYYEALSGSTTRLERKMSGMEGVIQDTAEFMNGGYTSIVEREINARAASIIDTVIHSSSADVTSIKQTLDGLSATVRTQIARLDTINGSITSINTELNGLEGRISTALTKADSALTEAMALRNEWNATDGSIIQEIADLVIEKDENGIPIYYWIGDGEENKIRVYITDRKDSLGNTIYTTNSDGTGTEYTTDVMPSYMTRMISYIMQNLDSITMQVSSGTILAALRLSVTDDGSLIYLDADRVVINSDVIANSLTSKSGNIGGVHIGAGMISASTGGNKWALTSAGTLEASNAVIRGAITASSLVLGSEADSFLSGYVGNMIKDISLSGSSGYSRDEILNMVAGYVNSQDFLDSSALEGYITEDALLAWADKQSGITAEYIKSIVSALSGTQITYSSGTTEDGSGTTRHTIIIGGVPYVWDTYDLGRFVLLDTLLSGGTGSATTKFLVDKNGLLQANNAIIYGAIYASEGWFKGSISADSGYFRGDVYANSLHLGNDSIQDYITGRINDAALSGTSGYSKDDIIGFVSGYVESRDFLEGDVLNGYVTEEGLRSWAATQSGITEEYVQNIISTLSGAEISWASATTENGSGGTRHSLIIGGNEYTWDTYDMRNAILLDTMVSGTSGETEYKFLVDKNGLLTANNAIIYGKIYASEGWFKGDVYADNGYFNGTINASGGTIGGLTINQYGISGDNINISNFYMGGTVSGDIIARSLVLKGDAQDTINGMIDGKIANLPEGITEDDVNRMLSAAAAASGWTAIDMGDYYKVGTRVVSGTSAFTVSKNGLLVANNAIISGTVFATNGVFNGTIYADNGRFMGEVTGAKISGSTMHAGKIYGSEIYGSKILVDGKRGEYISFYFTVGDDGEGYDAILGNISKALDYDVTFYFEGNPNNLSDFQTFTVCIEHGRTYGVCLLDGREELPARLDDMSGGNVITDYMGVENVASYTGNISDIDIVLNAGRSTVPQEYLSIPSNLNGKVIYSPKFSTSASTQYFEVLQNGQMTANNAIINGDITMNSGNSIVMYNSGGQPSFMLSSDKVSIDNVSTTYSLKERTLYSNAYGIYDSNRGYAGYDDDGFQSTIWCSITKRAGDQFTTYPYIRINVSRDYRGGSGYARGEVRVLWNNYVVSSITISTNELVSPYNSTSKTLYLQNILSSKQGSSGTLLITYEGETMATANAPSMQSEDTYGRGTVTFSASQGITVQSSTGSTDTRFFVGSNGIQMRLDGGSNLTFGIIDGHPRFHCELRENGSIVGGIDIDGTNGVRYWPKNGSQYKELT